MLLLILAYIGGVLTIACPCILPVLPFVFARADMPGLTPPRHTPTLPI
jgi:cytochrome c biogenesis protein CcdA